MKLLLAILALVNITIIVVLLYEWRILSENTKKILAFICLGVFPAIWGSAVLYHDLQTTQRVSFCARCHVMTEYVESLKVDDDEPISAVHYQNNWVPQEKACYVCHTSYTMFGPIKTKINGLKHLYVYYIKGPPKKLKLYQKYQNRDCLRCHGTAKKYNKNKKHVRVKNLLVQLESGKRSCLENGCHDLAHLLESDDW